MLVTKLMLSAEEEIGPDNGQDSEAEVRSEILKLNLVKSSKLKFGQDLRLTFGLAFEA